MSKIFFAVFITIFFAFSAAAQSEQINWEKDYKQALALSRETGKPIIVDFWAKWCAPCLTMDREFWTRGDVIEAVKAFVPLKLDYDAEKNLVSHFVVRGLPYVAFADPFGNLVASRRGFGSFDASDIKQIFNDMPKDYSKVEPAFKAFEQRKDDSAALLQIGDYYARHKLPIPSGRYYQFAYGTPEIKRDAAKKESVLAKIGQQFYNAGSFYQAMYSFQDYLKFFPEGANKETVYATLTLTYVNLGKLAEAGKTLDKLKTEFPASNDISGAERAITKAKK